MRRGLQRILKQNRVIWDNDDFSPRTRAVFAKIVKCGTIDLGAKMYSSDAGENALVYFSCKQKLCPSCGRRRTLDWIDEINERLPETAYLSLGFTMHSNLWEIFQRNPNLLRDLPALAIGVVQDYARTTYGAEIAVIAVTHSYGGDLKFNPHVHAIMATRGLETSSKKLTGEIKLSKTIMLEKWRDALLAYLMDLHSLGAVESSRSDEEIRNVFKKELNRPLRGQVKPVDSKLEVVNYICRYASRAPFANRNILSTDGTSVCLLIKRKDEGDKTRRRKVVRMTIRDFLRKIETHIAPTYSHAVHYFGLLSPRSSKQLALYCAALHHKKPRLKPRQTWEERMEQFGRRPLVDSQGNRMRLRRFILPK